MTFKRIFKENILVTAWIFLFMFIISKIEFNSDIFNPMAKAFEDFELTDIVYSHLRETPEVDTNIVVVNIGSVSRHDLAAMIDTINKFKPKVIAIDAFFRTAKHSEDPMEDAYLVAGDSALSNAFAKTENLVLVSELIENDSAKTQADKVANVSYSHPMFMQHATPGFADMITKGHDYIKYARNCIPKEEFKGKTIYSFPTQIVHIYDSVACKNYLARNKDEEIINYQGNIDPRTEGISENSKNVFYALDIDQVLNQEFDPSVIKGKIVIMGYLGNHIGHNTWEDKFCTPLNINYIGRTLPDMYGVVVHANIVSMVLKRSFIKEMPEWLNNLIGIFFVFIVALLFSWLFLNTAEWWDGLNMVASLLGVLIITGFMMIIFNSKNYIVDISIPSVALLLSGNLVEIYWGILRPFYFKKLKEKFIFKKSNEQILE